MKRLLLALVLLWPGAAFAQVSPETYAVATPAHILLFNPSTNVTITTPILNRVVELTCTASCFLWVNASGQNFPASKTTGVFLPPNVSRQYSVSPGSKVRVIGDTGAGLLHVIELTK